MEVNDIVKLLLAVSFSVSMVGLSIQVMRILGTLNAFLQDARYLAYQATAALENLAQDYKQLKTKLGSVFEPLSQINENFIQPVTGMATTLGAVVTVLKSKIFGAMGTDRSQA